MIKAAMLVCFSLLAVAVVLAQETTTPQRTFEIDFVEDFQIEGGVPNATFVQNAADEATVVLLYTRRERGIIQAESADGITFEGVDEPFHELTHLFDTLKLMPADVIMRQTSAGNWRYFIKGLPRPEADQQQRYMYAAEMNDAGELILLNEGEPVYKGRAEDGERVEVIDIIVTPTGEWRLFYVALHEKEGNTHTAISTDEGLTWEFESDNPFGDVDQPPRPDLINVDPAPLALADGTYMAVTMREGEFHFWNSADGLTFTEIPDLVLSPAAVSDFVAGRVDGFFDPTLVQMPDGTIYMYFTVGVDTSGYILLAQLTPVEAE